MFCRYWEKRKTFVGLKKFRNILKLSRVVPVVVQKMYLCRMNKQASIIMAVVTLFAVMAHAQTVYQKDRWGDAVYYFDYEPTIWQIACIILL